MKRSYLLELYEVENNASKHHLTPHLRDQIASEVFGLSIVSFH